MLYWVSKLHETCLYKQNFLRCLIKFYSTQSNMIKQGVLLEKGFVTKQIMFDCWLAWLQILFTFLKPVKGRYYASVVLLFDWLIIVQCSNVLLLFRLNLVTLSRMSKQRFKTRKVKHCWLVLQISLCSGSNSQTKDFENFKTVTVLREMPYGGDLICSQSCLNYASGNK